MSELPTRPSSAKHNAIILSFAQAVNGATGVIAISLGALAGYHLLGTDKALATLPVAAYAVGAALMALPVGLLTQKIGRKAGFISGAGLGILGAVLAFFSLYETAFWWFCFSFLVIGGASAFVQQYRFAAADQGDDKFKSRAISWVLTGGVLTAFIGPQTVLRTKDALLPDTPYAGAFIAMAILFLLGVGILAMLKSAPAEPVIPAKMSADMRPLLKIMRQPIFIVALFCAVCSYALMTFVMTGAPLAMALHGHGEDNAVTGIQWHVLAMFGPSFFTGLLIVRFGKLVIIAAGLFLLLLCAGIALSGLELWNFWVSLILLGVGWNFGFIGSTALLGETYRENEKNKVQGVHDCILFSIVAAASLSSGATLNAFGWHGVAIVIVPVASFALLSLAWLSWRTKTA